MFVSLFYSLNENPNKLVKSMSCTYLSRKKIFRRNSFDTKIHYTNIPKQEIPADIVLHVIDFIDDKKILFSFYKSSKYYYNLTLVCRRVQKKQKKN